MICPAYVSTPSFLPFIVFPTRRNFSTGWAYLSIFFVSFHLLVVEKRRFFDHGGFISQLYELNVLDDS